MRAFAIYNPLERNRRAAAWVLYEPGSDTYSIEIAAWARPEDLPLMLAMVAREGQRTIGDHLARRWVASRIPPEERSNIHEILGAWNHESYYAPRMFAATAGRSSMDDFLVEEVPGDSYRTHDLNRTLESPVDLGVQLSRARRAAGLTQSQLAEACGIQQAVISRIERGQGNPTIETMELLARGCGRSLRISLD